MKLRTNFPYKISVEIDVANNPDLAGELLRNAFFDQSEGRGCYVSFKLRDNVKELPSKIIDGINFHYACAEFDGKEITMEYWWDGDGSLSFIFEDGCAIQNNDCKKTYNWKFYSKEEMDRKLER